MNKDRLSQLFELQVSQRATEAERDELRGMMALPEHEEQLKVLFAELWEKYTTEDLVFSARESAEMLKRIFEVTVAGGQQSEREEILHKKVALWPRLRLVTGIAAAVATIVFGIWFFAYRPARDALRLQTEAYAKNIVPGKRGATLSLSTGEVIQLSEAKKGVIVGNGKIVYSDSSLRGGRTKQSSDEVGLLRSSREVPGSLLRNGGSGGGHQNGKMLQMTASTAKGQTYEFTLSDGSHVFLNADSKISFPLQFSEKERKILLEGEAYFLVVHNKKQPFRVESKAPGGGKQTVEDIGTAFNINAYADEGTVKTTLVEGSASVITLRTATVLRPSQQSTLSGGRLKVNTVNIEDVLAWKDGQFKFSNTPLSEILRQIGRWYNLEIVYEDQEAGKRTFTGVIRRDSRLSEILRVFEKGGIQFRIADPKKAGGAKLLIVM